VIYFYIFLISLFALFIYYYYPILLYGQFANTEEVNFFQEKGFGVTNINNTGLLPSLIIELKEPYKNSLQILNDTASSIVKEIDKNNQLESNATIQKDINTIQIDYRPDPLFRGSLHASLPLLSQISEDVLDLAQENPRTENRELDEVYVAQYETVLLDEYSSHLIQQANNTQIIPTGIDRINSEITNKKIEELGNVDIDIAILDSGINPHPDLNIVTDKQVYFAGNSPYDNCGHGTHVAGIAGAKNNEFGIVGTAPGARLWNVKVLELNPIDKDCIATKLSLMKGLNFVLKNAEEIDIVNLSLGGFCDSNQRILCNSPLLETAILNVISKGIPVVVAAGNGENGNGSDSVNWKPAKFGQAITVSNFVDSDGKCGGKGKITHRGSDDFLANNSNYGIAIDISAPGVNVLYTSNNGSYVVYSGTSMAAPYVSGAAALYKSFNPQSTVNDIILALQYNGVSLGSHCYGNTGGYIIGGDPDTSPEPILDMRNLIGEIN
jgi:subtilisin family serine protease